MLTKYYSGSIFNFMEKETPIQSVVRVLGGQTRTADLLNAALPKDSSRNVTQKNIWNWLNRGDVIDPYYAPFLEQLTEQAGEKILKEEISPDFPWQMVCSKNGVAA